MGKQSKCNIWLLYSKSDCRWNGAGTSLMPVGMGTPTECQRLIDAYKRIYGEPPKDLKITYGKPRDGGCS